MENVKGKRVFVGLSGGVDSAVSAALLQRGGASVTGVFIKGWYPPGLPCTWAADRRDAMRVAARLEIPFLTLDASAEYKENVIDYLVSEYRAGRTPNPDVMCNRDIKFGAFHRFARARGADAIATGHYRSGEKNQTYFLWAVPKKILEEALFPVGQMDKSEVRALARTLNLPVADKRDSQGVCFLGSVSVKEFLKGELGGDSEALLYTIGERVRGGYVVGKDLEKNALILSDERAPVLARAGISFTDTNWLADPSEVREAQYRYRGPLIKGRVEPGVGEKYRFTPNGALPEIPAPGQSLVCYAGDALIGGGIIA